MARTPEQQAADEALTQAIEAVTQAYDPEGAMAGFILGEYVVVSSRQGWDDDGDGITSVGTMFRDGDVPTHRALGLLAYARRSLEHYITQGQGE